MEVNVIINGKSIKTNSEKTILQVARENDIFIPSLCYLKDINAPASCRVCVVEVVGQKNLVTSCSQKVKDGMQIITNSQRVIKARKTALELLLSSHNQDCLNCEKNLKCSLQKLSKEYMCNANKYDGEKTEQKLDTSNGVIIRDESKCILCGRCEAVCSKVQGCDAIGKQNRGFKTQIGTAFNVGLNNSTCTSCGQCVLACPTGALTVVNEVNKVLNILEQDNVVKIAQVAPSVRVSLPEEFGGDIGTFCEGKMVSALKECGFNYVFDVNMGADFTIVEEAGELIEKLGKKSKMPLFTSCCPAWVSFVKKFYPEYEKCLFTSKSPNEMLASLVKYYFEREGKKVKIVSIMPCSAKKQEIKKYNTVDVSLTTRELAHLIKLKGINFNCLQEECFDAPFKEYSGGGIIFGASGGVTESALRYVGYQLTQNKQGIITKVRENSSVKEVQITLGTKKINLAIVCGLNNAKNLLQKIKQGKKNFDFVEVMACPGGCINGGGQCYVNYDQTDVKEVIAKRKNAIYARDNLLQNTSAKQNQSVQEVYKNLLNNDKNLIHKLLHN